MPKKIGLPTDRSTHWHIACAGAVGGGAVLTGGGWVFEIQSWEINVRSHVVFAGAGIGFGAKAGGTGPTDLTVDYDDFTPITTVVNMSLADLNASWGWINSAGVAIGYGAGVMLLTACSMRGTLFGMQPVAGFSAGLEGSLNLCTAGTWRTLGEPKECLAKPRRSGLPPWSQIQCQVARERISVGPRAVVNRRYDLPRMAPGANVMTPGGQ
ncbi:hypothetical protein [Aliiruegeria lutimaris]|uniref:Uncharacterized protein n=1 Tax=Aliiruegeria lutimaris TaxID=571298 RepID=A0A1G8P3V6_9RHOB|nr:hypothetical protein [Aliiruegeria lutimaris]SDI86510.1 hypothetical protein SAMN04488026_100849 [Aliiruegeria lutimaris]